MTTYGETETGFRRKTFSEIQGDIRTKLRARISKSLKLDDKDWVGNAVDVFSDELDLSWQSLEYLRNALDPDNAEGSLMVAQAALTGTNRRDPTKGLVTCSCEFEAGKEYDAGELVAHVNGDPENRWVNLLAVELTAGGAEDVVFQAESTGAFRALAGTLTVIAQTASGWLTVTNAGDAVPGTELEEIDDLRVRREAELGDDDSSTVDGIRSDVLQAMEDIDGAQCRVFDNKTDEEVDGIPAHGVRVLIWDGVEEEADDDVIAQAIFNSASGGTPTVGAESGTALDSDGGSVTMYFDRATRVDLYLTGQVVAPNGASEEDLILAIQADVPGTIGERVIFKRLESAPLSVAGVDDVIAFKLGTSPAPTGEANITPANDAILVLDSANINLTITASE